MRAWHMLTHSPMAHGLSAAPTQDLWTPVMLALLAGLSTGLGGAIVLLLDGEPSKASMAAALSLAGSVMVYVSVELSCEAVLAGGAAMYQGLASLAAGALCFYGLQALLPEAHEHEEKPAREADEEQPLVRETDKDLSARNWRLGVLMMLVLTAHNFPEGLAVAVSAMDSSRLGVLVAVAVAAHNIPEGIVIAVPLYAASKSRTKAVGWALLSGLTEPFGALCAVLFLRGWVSEQGLQAILCLVAGMMLAVSFIELFPSAWKYGEPAHFCAGLVGGCAIMALTDYLV